MARREHVTPQPRCSNALPHRSALLIRLFDQYTRHYLGRHFHAVRLSRAGGVPMLSSVPAVVYLNHPSWWDPLLSFYLACSLFPERQHYAPIDAKALARYRFFTRLGFFGVELNTRRGAATFLRLGRAILKHPASMLWLTPTGTFADPRARGVPLRSGLGHLAQRLERGVLLPLALEYPFWEERFPEALVRFGAPILAGAVAQCSAAAWTALLAQQLEATQDALALEACSRDRAVFTVLLTGRAGVGGIYDCWRALRARWRGEPWQREHGEPDV